MKERLLKLHLTTEKSTILKETGNEYVFRVARGSTKLQIKDAIEKSFSVKVRDVRTMIVPGKQKRYGRNVTKTQKWKKAIVKLEKDQVISDFESI